MLAVLQMIVAAVYCVAGLILAQKRKQQLVAQLENFSFCSEAVTRAAVLNFPSPMAVTTVGGAIQWYNYRFQEMVGRENLFGEYIQDIFLDLQFGRFVEDGDPTPEEYSYKGRDYMAAGRVVTTRQADEDSRMVSIYFTDLTQIHQMRQQLADKKIVVCTAVIDNYDEVFKNTPNNCHGALIGQIEHCVNTWVEKGEGIAVRYERDKFLILFETAKYAPLLKEKLTN